MSNRTSCAGCAHDLGGGQCSVSLEAECGAGGYEDWVPRRVFASIEEVAKYHDKYMPGMSFHAQQTDVGYVVRWGD